MTAAPVSESQCCAPARITCKRGRSRTFSEYEQTVLFTTSRVCSENGEACRDMREEIAGTTEPEGVGFTGVEAQKNRRIGTTTATTTTAGAAIAGTATTTATAAGGCATQGRPVDSA